MPLPPDLVTIAAEGCTLDIDLARGARAVSWRVDGWELLGVRSDDPVEYGMYPMAPWAGRLRGNAVECDGGSVPLPVTYEPWALHGTVLDSAGEVLELTSSRLSVRFTAHAGWPWTTHVTVEWSVEPGAVQTDIRVEAVDEPFPAVVGWHPWFRRSLESGGPLEWSLDAVCRLERGDDHLPTGRRMPFDATEGPFDDAFEVPSGTAHVRWPGALAMDIAAEGDWYVVYDQTPDLVCVEPQSGPPDGLRDAPLVQPGRPLVMRTTWRFRSDDRPGDRA